MANGIDYAFNPHPPLPIVSAAGVAFVCRYTSPDAVNDRNGKNLIPSELAAIRAAGLAVVMVFESGAGRMKSGKAAGVADAQHADAVVKALGMAGMPLYFACDFDATPGDQTAINAYLDGVASVIGRARTGIYAGFYPVKRAFDAGKIAYAWQTYAWSGGQWDSRAQLRQVQNGVSLGGVSLDLDKSMTADYGQFPRPGTPAGHATISVGAKGADVKLCQERLNVWGAKLVVDSAFEALTKAAVMAFQAKVFGPGPNVDGVVGPLTWAALLKDPAPVPVPPPSAPKYGAPLHIGVDPSAQVTISWDAPKSVSGLPAEPAGYRVFLHRGVAPHDVPVAGFPKNLPGTQTSITLSLPRGTAFYVNVVALTEPDGTDTAPAAGGPFTV